MILNRNKTTIQKFSQVYAINVDSYSNSYMKKWNMDAYNMCKKTKNATNNNIRIYLQRRMIQIKFY